MAKDGWKIVHMVYDNNNSWLVCVFEDGYGNQKIRNWGEGEEGDEWMKDIPMPTDLDD